MRRWKARMVKAVALAGLVGLALMFVPGVAIAASYAPGQVWSPPQTPLPTTTPVPRSSAPTARSAIKKAPTAAVGKLPTVDLPEASTATASLAPAVRGAQAAAARGGSDGASKPLVAARVGTSPVWVAAATSGAAAPSKVQVRFADPAAARRAGFPLGLVFGVARSDASTAAGKVDVQFEPSLLSGEGGGNLGQRLYLVELPACALTTPDLPACQTRTPVKATVDPSTGRLVVTAVLAPGSTVPAAQAAQVPADRAVTAVKAETGHTAGAVATDVSSPMTVVAAVSAPSGSAGTYTATSIKPSDQWSAGGSTGDFTYSYPITVPPTLGGSAPSVALSYASSSVDGETAADSSQVSEVGDGWAGMSSFIERSYQSCATDGITNSGDTCWADGGHEVSLNGGNLGGQMVYDDATGKWHISGSAATVQLVTGGANGAYDGEYWEITTEDGTRMYYGAGKLPTAEGGKGTDVATNSVSTEPVYCPTAGDCDKAPSGSSSDFTPNMAYRWYLDFVVDPHGNTTEYNYTQETNYYARSSAHTLTAYDRGAYLDSISYGWRTADIVTEAAKPAPASKVTFSYSTRCVVGSVVSILVNGVPTNHTVTATDCATLTATSAPYWGDVPQDQVCASTGTCSNDAITYFSEMRLTGIATYVNEGSTSTTKYQEVDSYALVQDLPLPGDGTSPELRLDSITRSGWQGTTSLAMPSVSFGYTQLANRVAGAAAWPAMMHYRLNVITDETGGVTDVFYSNPDCNQSTTSPDLPTPSADTRQCYQEYWTPPQSTAFSDWFEKYTVSEVEQLDAVGGSPDQVTKYIYPPDGAAWHRNDSPLTPNSQRTWDQWRGYGSVITETGTAPDPITETETTYLRGMDGDSTSATADTPGAPVTVSDTMGDPAVTDSNQYAGFALETQTFTQAGGTVVKDEVSLPWSASTASHAETGTGVPAGLPPEQAWFVEPQTTIDRGLMSDGKTWRTTKSVELYSAITGLPVQTDDQGDISQLGTPASTEACSTVTYATPPSTGLNTGMTGLVAETTTVSVTSGNGVGTGACPGKTAANTISDNRTFYDGDPVSAPGVIPAAGVGNVTEQETMGTWSGSTETWTVKSTSPDTAAGFDVYGRQLSSTDVRGDTTANAYMTANPGTLPTSTSITNVTAGNATTTTTVDQARQLPTKLVDANGNTTVESYDALGRLTDVWLPGNTTADASKVFTYSLGGQSARTWTETQTLRANRTYSTEFEIYNGFMQPVQEQTLSLDSGDSGGTNVTDYAYDSHGWQIKTSSTPYYITTAPSSTVYPTTDADVPGQTVTTYDGMGRSIESEFFSYGQPQWSSSTLYSGVDRTDVTAPPGGTATTTFTDAQGRTTASWQYHGSSPTDGPGSATVTSYAYSTGTNAAGVLQSQTTITDAGGHVWTQTTDDQGNQVAATDPDVGGTSATYDAAGDELTSTDANGTVLSYTYDILGRKLTESNITKASAPVELESWSYDTAPGGIGQPASQTSYYNGNAYTQTTTGYTDLGAPTGVTTTIPAAEGNLAGTYSVGYAYNALTGALYTTTYGADGGLPAETVYDAYTVGGVLANISGNADYLTAVTSNPLGQTTRATLGGMPDQLVQTNVYDDATDRVTESFLDAENDSTGHLDDTSTYWDAAGQITAQNDVEDDGANTDLQCYTYDGQGRLTAAWTDTGGVSAAASPSVPNIGGCKSASPSAATNGGPAPYWETYAYDPNGQSSGNRSTVTDYNTSGTITTQQSYGYNTATGTTGQPDTLQTLNTTNGAGTTLSSASYTYNPDGSTATHTVTNGSGTPTSSQTYTYDPNGLTSTITDTTANTKAGYQYDASGNLLLQKDTIAGATTSLLYLPDEQLTMNSSGGITALRYYDTPSGITVIRDNTGNITYQASTSQGTGTLTISAALTNENRRYFTPYGNTRGTAPMTWVDGRSFLNQPNDPATGLDLLGAREYDPTTGRFLSRDPILEATDPNQLGGYAYSGDDPINTTDPTGLQGSPPGGGWVCPPAGTGACVKRGGGGSGGHSTGDGGTGNGDPSRGGTGEGSGDGETCLPGFGGCDGPPAASVVHARIIEQLDQMFAYCRNMNCRNEVTAQIKENMATATPLTLLVVAIENAMQTAPAPDASTRPITAASSTYNSFDCGHLGTECSGNEQPIGGGSFMGMLHELAHGSRIVGNWTGNLSTILGGISIALSAADAIPGVDEVTGVVGGIAGQASTGLAAVSAIAYYAGGDFKDGNTNLIVAGAGVALGGVGGPIARFTLRDGAAGNGFLAKGIIALFGTGADSSRTANGIAGAHLGVPGTLFGATSIFNSWNSDPGGDW